MLSPQDYSDLNVALSSIQVTPCTAAELTRLCLRKRDAPAPDEGSDDGSEAENAQDEVVSGRFGPLHCHEWTSVTVFFCSFVFAVRGPCGEAGDNGTV